MRTASSLRPSNRRTWRPRTVAMPSYQFLHALVRLASLDNLERVLDAALILMKRDLGLLARIELWNGDQPPIVRGDSLPRTPTSHCTWIGGHYTIGVIRLQTEPEDLDDVELLASQLAPLAERLLERDVWRAMPIREEVKRVFERRIRDALVRYDWNASAVARELVVSRKRIADVSRRYAKHSTKRGAL